MSEHIEPGKGEVEELAKNLGIIAHGCVRFEHVEDRPCSGCLKRAKTLVELGYRKNPQDSRGEIDWPDKITSHLDLEFERPENKDLNTDALQRAYGAGFNRAIDACQSAFNAAGYIECPSEEEILGILDQMRHGPAFNVDIAKAIHTLLTSGRVKG